MSRLDTLADLRSWYALDLMGMPLTPSQVAFGEAVRALDKRDRKLADYIGEAMPIHGIARAYRISGGEAKARIDELLIRLGHAVEAAAASA